MSNSFIARVHSVRPMNKTREQRFSGLQFVDWDQWNLLSRGATIAACHKSGLERVLNLSVAHCPSAQVARYDRPSWTPHSSIHLGLARSRPPNGPDLNPVDYQIRRHNAPARLRNKSVEWGRFQTAPDWWNAKQRHWRCNTPKAQTSIEHGHITLGHFPLPDNSLPGQFPSRTIILPHFYMV